MSKEVGPFQVQASLQEMNFHLQAGPPWQQRDLCRDGTQGPAGQANKAVCGSSMQAAQQMGRTPPLTLRRPAAWSTAFTPKSVPVCSPAPPDKALTGQSHAAFRLCECSAFFAQQIFVSSCPHATLRATLHALGRQQHSEAQASSSQRKPCAECAVLRWGATVQEPYRKFVVHVASERVHLSAQLASGAGLLLPALELRARWRQHLHGLID